MLTGERRQTTSSGLGSSSRRAVELRARFSFAYRAGRLLTRSFSANRLTAHGGLLSPAEAFVSRLGLAFDGKGGTQWRVHDAWW